MAKEGKMEKNLKDGLINKQIMRFYSCQFVSPSVEKIPFPSFPRQAKAALNEEISVAVTELVGTIVIFSAFIRWKIEHIVCSGCPIHCSTRCLMKWERCPPVSIVTQLFHLFATNFERTVLF